MKSLYFLLPVFVLVTSFVLAQKQTPPVGGQPRDFNLPQRKTITLSNGLKASWVPYGDIPKAMVRIYVRTGNMHEKENEVWLSDLLAKLMQEGSTSRNAQAVAEEVARMGGSLSISSTPNAMIISGSVLTEFAPALIRIMAEVLTTPRLPRSEIERLKADLKRQLTVQQAEPQVQANAAFMALLYPNQPYGRSYPTAEMIEEYNLAKVRGFYDAQVGAQRTHVYVSGKFDQAAVEKAIRGSFDGWQKGPAMQLVVAEPVTNKGFSFINRAGSQQSTIILGLPVTDPSRPDWIPLWITNSLLSGSFGSRITTNIRESKGYTYSPYSWVDSYYHSAVWSERADVATEHTGAALVEIVKEINQLRQTPPAKDELIGIQQYETGVFVLRHANPFGILTQLAAVDLHGLDDSYLTGFVKTVMSVSPEQVQQLAQNYLDPQRMTLVVVGDQPKVEPQLTLFKEANNNK